MLIGIPKLLSPELLKVLCEMGHSDRLVIADGNFPAESVGKSARVVRCDGIGAAELLEAILQVFPLDTYVEKPVFLMQVEKYTDIVARHDRRGDAAIGHIKRFAFYEEAKSAYAIIATGETALYANIMMQKGVVAE